MKFKHKDGGVAPKQMKKINSRDSNKDSGSDSGGSSGKSKHGGSRDSGSTKSICPKQVFQHSKHNSESDQNPEHEDNGLVVTKKLIGDGHQAKVYVAEIRGTYNT